MHSAILFLMGGLLLSGPQDAPGDEKAPAAATASNAPDVAVVSEGRITLIADIEIPAEEAGVLRELKVEEGSDVKMKDEIGKIEDRKATIEKKVAQAEADAAEEQAKSDVPIQVAEKAGMVAQKEYEAGIEANKGAGGLKVVAQIEIARRKFEWDRALLTKENAELEQAIAKHTSLAKKTMVEAADYAIERRKLISPVNGRVKEILKHPGEWVMAGDTVLRIVRLDQLRLKGNVDARNFRPVDLQGKQAAVEVTLPGGRKEQFKGVVRHTDPEINADHFAVWIDVENRQEGGDWLLLPGMSGGAEIQLQGKTAIKSPERAKKKAK